MVISRRRTCDLKTCEGLIEAYCKIPGGEYHILQEGVLGLGLCVCSAPRIQSGSTKRCRKNIEGRLRNAVRYER